jgi:hypothetical protein
MLNITKNKKIEKKKRKERGAQWPSGQCARRLIAEAKQRS